MKVSTEICRRIIGQLPGIKPPATGDRLLYSPPPPPPPHLAERDAAAGDRREREKRRATSPLPPAMSVETERSSTESSAASGLDFEDTALTLRLPGSSSSSSSSSSEPDCKRASTSDDDPDNRRGSTATESPPSPKARVVGWPPVRAFRKNALAASAAASSSKAKFVKVAVDGAPYLRKVDLEAYRGYDQLLAALQDKFFSHFTIRKLGNEEMKLVDAVSGNEYVPTYEDKDGDWMLVGDVPWKMFVETCQRLRLMKSSEAVNLAPRSAR